MVLFVAVLFSYITHVHIPFIVVWSPEMFVSLLLVGFILLWLRVEYPVVNGHLIANEPARGMFIMIAICLFLRLSDLSYTDQIKLALGLNVCLGALWLFMRRFKYI